MNFASLHSPFAISLLAFLAAFAITYFSIPAIIRLSAAKGLYDLPDDRKQHTAAISPLGGIAIFGGLIISFVFFTAHLANPTLNSVLVALFILFITGVKDDLYPLVPYKKLLGQLLAVAVVIGQGDVRLISLYGILDLHAIPYPVSLLLSSLFFLGIINSFNFLDGINGLSSLSGIMVSAVYAVWFYYFEEPLFLTLALCIIGSQLAFLRYNFGRHARIFMGDSGSMILGFFAALLSIYFLQSNEREFIETDGQSADFVLKHIDAMLFAFAVLILPLFDTARVSFIRVFIKGRSPFRPDRNHLHHVLLDIGQSHLSATLILVGCNLLFIALCWFLNPYIRASLLFTILLALAFAMSQIPFFIKKQQKKRGANAPSS